MNTLKLGTIYIPGSGWGSNVDFYTGSTKHTIEVPDHLAEEIRGKVLDFVRHSISSIIEEMEEVRLAKVIEARATPLLSVEESKA